MTQIKVDYNNSILSVSNSVLKYFNGTSRYKTLPELDAILKKNYKNVVLMIVDCMGTSILKKNLSENSFLNQHILKNISSVFPPTTVAATTAFHSGLPPIYSGWLGWMCYSLQDNKFIELFMNTEFYSGKPVVDSALSKFIKYETIYSQIINANPDVEYYKIFPPFAPDGVRSFKEMCDKIVQVTKQNSHRKIISAYWNEPDCSIHQYGTKSQEIKDILEDIERNVMDLNEKIEENKESNFFDKVSNSINDTFTLLFGEKKNNRKRKHWLFGFNHFFISYIIDPPSCYLYLGYAN